jgi:hypothetical protein
MSHKGIEFEPKRREVHTTALFSKLQTRLVFPAPLFPMIIILNDKSDFGTIGTGTGLIGLGLGLDISGPIVPVVFVRRTFESRAICPSLSDVVVPPSQLLHYYWK